MSEQLPMTDEELQAVDNLSAQCGAFVQHIVPRLLHDVRFWRDQFREVSLIVQRQAEEIEYRKSIYKKSRLGALGDQLGALKADNAALVKASSAWVQNPTAASQDAVIKALTKPHPGAPLLKRLALLEAVADAAESAMDAVNSDDEYSWKLVIPQKACDRVWDALAALDAKAVPDA